MSSHPWNFNHATILHENMNALLEKLQTHSSENYCCAFYKGKDEVVLHNRANDFRDHPFLDVGKFSRFLTPTPRTVGSFFFKLMVPCKIAVNFSQFLKSLAHI